VHITKWKKPVKKAAHCLIPTVLHSGKSKAVDSIKISLAAGGLAGKREGLWNYCDLKMDPCHYATLQTHTIQRMDSRLPYGPRLINIYQYLFINCNECSTLVWNINREIGREHCFLFHFYVNLRILWNQRLFIKETDQKNHNSKKYFWNYQEKITLKTTWELPYEGTLSINKVNST
jgi:hypothetical protein